jgi:hypothetical protein
MSDNGAPQPTELVYVAKPLVAPFFAALGLLGLIAGIYANGYGLPSWVYSVVGGVFLLAAIWSWIGVTRRDIAELPREQQRRSAVLPPNR